jgi:hypothetical protein
MAGFLFDVFLIHHSEDKPRVRKLARRPKEAGLRAWIDESSIKPGVNIFLAVENGLQQSRV